LTIKIQSAGAARLCGQVDCLVERSGRGVELALADVGECDA
jgi:hypothetical protein